eukprot:SAG25_NODE_1164_length_3718_cov_2.842222_1_plen_101_part_10
MHAKERLTAGARCCSLCSPATVRSGRSVSCRSMVAALQSSTRRKNWKSSKGVVCAPSSHTAPPPVLLPSFSPRLSTSKGHVIPTTSPTAPSSGTPPPPPPP